MKVAVFRNLNDGEVIVLAVKGKGKGSENIDGYNDYFGVVPGRDIRDYTATMGHIGTGFGLVIQPLIRVDIHSYEQEIDDWFPENNEE